MLLREWSTLGAPKGKESVQAKEQTRSGEGSVEMVKRRGRREGAVVVDD